MSKVGIIKAINNQKVSTTEAITNTFIEAYTKANPNDEIVIINTYDIDAKPLLGQDIDSMFGGTDEKFKAFATELASFDKIVIAAPMWNLSIPASLKCYIDYITYAGVTFKYTENGPIGLLDSPKVMHITSRGGIYQEGPFADFEMGDRYLRTIFGFMGATDFETIAFEATGMFDEATKASKLEEIKQIAATSAAKF